LHAESGEWPSVEFEAQSGVRSVRVETLAVDGWVILHEVRVLGEALLITVGVVVPET
jgi:hypothetical protein